MDKNKAMSRCKLGGVLLTMLFLFCYYPPKKVNTAIEKNCTCTFQEYQTQLNEQLRQHANNPDDVDGCYKPVIYYNEHLYWLSTEHEEKRIPNDFSQIGTAQCIVIDGLSLPKKQLESNLVWGSILYGNGEDERLYADTEGYISVYINETLLENE